MPCHTGMICLASTNRGQYAHHAGVLTMLNPIFDRRHFLKHLAGYSAMAVAAFITSCKAWHRRPFAEEAQQEPDHFVDERRPAHDQYIGIQARPANRRRFPAYQDRCVRDRDQRAHAQSGQADEAPGHCPFAGHQRGGPQPRPGLDAHGPHSKPHCQLSINRLADVVSAQSSARRSQGSISIGRPDGPGFLGMNYAPFTVQNPGQPPENIRPPADMANDKGRIYRRKQAVCRPSRTFRRHHR